LIDKYSSLRQWIRGQRHFDPLACSLARSPGILQPSAELRFAQVIRFQRQTPGYRRKFVAPSNSLLAKSAFEDSPHGWNK
jgi:hypothetical protein